MIVDVFMCRKDNFGYLAHDTETGATAAIDAPEAEPIRTALHGRGWELTDIFITHHHADHTDGIAALKKGFGVRVTGPRAEADRIGGLDNLVAAGESVMLGGIRLDVLGVPGHTLGHIAYHDPGWGHLFTGDALFSLGVGRMFEGTPGPMWAGLEALRRLPDDTLLYVGHEYTKANAAFALSVDPRNAALRQRAAEIEALALAGRFTIPTTLGAEKAANPFLRADRPELAEAVGLAAGSDPAEVFGALRRAKDDF
jgi:hydroxyacylglutathione hydrolase